jgi:hypothetical protein
VQGEEDTRMRVKDGFTYGADTPPVVTRSRCSCGDMQQWLYGSASWGKAGTARGDGGPGSPDFHQFQTARAGEAGESRSRVSPLGLHRVAEPLGAGLRVLRFVDLPPPLAVLGAVPSRVGRRQELHPDAHVGSVPRTGSPRIGSVCDCRGACEPDWTKVACSRRTFWPK